MGGPGSTTAKLSSAPPATLRPRTVAEAGVGPAPVGADLVMTFEPVDLPSFRSLMRAAKCGLVKLVGRRELLDTFIRLFTVPQTA